MGKSILLPEAIVNQIVHAFFFDDGLSIGLLGLVDRFLARLASQNDLWRSICLREFRRRQMLSTRLREFRRLAESSCAVEPSDPGSSSETPWKAMFGVAFTEGNRQSLTAEDLVDNEWCWHHKHLGLLVLVWRTPSVKTHPPHGVQAPRHHACVRSVSFCTDGRCSMRQEWRSHGAPRNIWPPAAQRDRRPAPPF